MMKIAFVFFHSMSFYKHHPLLSVIFQYGIIFVLLFATLHAPLLVLLYSSSLLMKLFKLRYFLPFTGRIKVEYFLFLQ